MKEEILLSLFHHIHHNGKEHKVHHCGGKHVSGNPELNYEILHCKCGKHSIDKKTAVGHTTDKNLDLFEIKIEFYEQCPYGGWHIEDGIQK